MSAQLPEYWHLLEWLTLHSSRYGLKFLRKDWHARPPGFPLHNVYCDIVFQERVFFGLGFASNPRLAHAVAAAEALERVGMAHLKLPNSNGCAVHLDEARAKSGALLELVERDSFLCHFYTGTPLGHLPSSLHERLASMRAFAHQHGWELSAGVLSNALGLPCVMVVANGFQRPLSRGIFTGLGIASEWPVALEKALAECWRFIDSDLADGSALAGLSLEEFRSSSGKGVREHVRLSVNPQYGRAVWDKLFPLSAAVDAVLPGVEESTRYSTFPLSDIFEGCPLVFAHAKNEALAQVGFGDRWQLSTDHARYRMFSTGGVTTDWPHCMG